MTTIDALIERFDLLRNSGVCSPTTRGLLDDAERLLRRQGLITDAMVETVWQTLELDEAGHYTRSNVRAALEASDRAR